MLCRSLGLMALSALCAFGADDLRVGVLWSAPASVPTHLIRELQNETGRIFNLPGLRFVWKNLADHSFGDSYNRVVVLRLKGSCSIPISGNHTRNYSLGLTHISDGNVLPFVEIDCTRIQQSLTSAAQPLPPFLLARALALVAVHELHHVLTASTVHDQEGVTKPSFSRQDLVLNDLSLPGAAVRRLQQSLQLVPLEAQSGRDQRANTEE